MRKKLIESCSLRGCGRIRGNSKLCQMHYKRKRLRKADWSNLSPQRRPNGTGTVTKDGYVRYGAGGKLVYEHTLVWEAANGPVPKGCHIHHKDEDTSNNVLSNLVCWSASKHKTYHLAKRFKDTCKAVKEID